MVREKELMCQEALGMILNTEFQETHFSTDGYKEEAVCMQKDEDSWIVYVGYRNTHVKTVTYGSVIEACLAVIDRLCRNNSNLALTLRNTFLDMVLVDKIA